ncbi:hypothetical protein V6N13_040350 [Hibiscus sabdariffa]
MAHLELSIPWHGSTKQPCRPIYLKFENRLLGPCFKTGWMGSPQADARSTLVLKHAETVLVGFHDRGDDVSTGVSKARAWAATTIRAGFDNDPSAGSPTATLLRLLLPLNDKVQWTSRDVAGSEPPTSPRSKHFTVPFNRINQVAFLRDVRLTWSSTHYLGRGEAITGREHHSCRGTKCRSYERTRPRPYAHEIFRI